MGLLESGPFSADAEFWNAAATSSRSRNDYLKIIKII